MPRLTRGAGLVAAAGLLATPRLVVAQTAAMRIVVPFGPGGSTDAVARLVAAGLQQRFGISVVRANNIQPG